MNEYMAVEARTVRGSRAIPTSSRRSIGRPPVSVGELHEGDELLVLRIAKQRIPLSSSVSDPSVYPFVEKTLGITLADYALGRSR